jgi:hypothetical protein
MGMSYAAIPSRSHRTRRREGTYVDIFGHDYRHKVNLVYKPFCEKTTLDYCINEKVVYCLRLLVGLYSSELAATEFRNSTMQKASCPILRCFARNGS